jgi:hypothetical protein
MIDKWQTRPLVREGAPNGQDSNFNKEENIWSWAPAGARHQDRQTDWPSVVTWLWLWLWQQAFSDHTSQSVITLGPERPVLGIIGSTLRQGQLPRPSGGYAQRTGQLAASTRRQPYPAHWVTGAAASRRYTSDRSQRPGVCQQPGSYPAAALRPGNRRIPPGNSRQLLHCDQTTNSAAITLTNTP